MDRPLAGLRVCMLAVSNYSNDARARKVAGSLSAAGATVTALGIGDPPPADVAGWAHAVRILSHRPAPFDRRYPWPLRRGLARVGGAIALSRVYLAGHTHVGEAALVRAATAVAPDVLHAFGIQTLRAAIRVKRRTGARVVYDCRDLFGDVDYGPAGLRARYRSAEAAFIGHADAVITVSEPLAAVLAQRHGIARPLIVHNGPSMVTPSPSPVHQPVRLLFLGAFQPNRNLAALVTAMRALRGAATLTLQGFGDLWERELREQVAALRLDDVVSFAPPVPPLAIVQSAVPHDVGVICYRGTSLNLRCAVPNKLMDYLGAGLAVVASDLPGHRSVLCGTGAAVLIDPSSPDTIAAGLRAVVHEPERLEAMKHAAVRAAKRYEWSRQATSLIRLYETLARAR